jgi:DNA repair protein RecN (Recombination protein N)
MLYHIHIQNYALIESLDIQLDKGFVAITGETGAGKSILLDALGLALGKRADANAISDKTKKCIIEVTFDIQQLNLESLLKEHDLDNGQYLILRREIYPDGRSRAFANDTPVNLNTLKVLSGVLIDIHSQHETLLLSDMDFQFNLIDSYADLNELKLQYQQSFQNYLKQKKQLELLIAEAAQSKKEYDYNQFQFNELNTLPLKEGYYQALESQYQILYNAEVIKTALAATEQGLVSGESNVLQVIHHIKTQVSAISKYDKSYEDIANRLQSLLIEIKDIAGECDDLNDKVEFNSQLLDETNTNLAQIQKLLKKHNASDDLQLLAVKEDLEVKLDSSNHIEQSINKVEKALRATKEQAMQLAEQLGEARGKAKIQFSNDLDVYLQDLAMPHAHLEVVLKDSVELNDYGMQNITFLFSANKGMEAKELSKVASGGEMSRLMLSLKAIMAKTKQIPTIIFDEIDTGVSGSVASKMAELMNSIGKTSQVLAITHLPQIASKSQSHLFVYKQDHDDKTTSYIKTLDKEARVAELSKMLGDGSGSKASVKNARELLGY